MTLADEIFIGCKGEDNEEVPSDWKDEKLAQRNVHHLSFLSRRPSAYRRIRILITDEDSFIIRSEPLASHAGDCVEKPVDARVELIRLMLASHECSR